MILPPETYNHPLADFSVVGVNYRKSDTQVRGNFTICEQRLPDLIKYAFSRGITSCFVLSTCNRTEIYGFCHCPNELKRVFYESTGSNENKVADHLYSLHGQEAIIHLLRVAAGLDSQIIGDYEILSQLKTAIKRAKREGAISGMMERIINHAFRASKEIKTKTGLSTGTVSVSYAAVAIIKECFRETTDKKILLVGTGKFGNQTAGNLREYFPDTKVLLTNRTDDKAVSMAKKFGFRFAPYQDLANNCNEADILIVNTSAPCHTVFPRFFRIRKRRLILDLSIPANVDTEVQKIPGIILRDVDQVSRILQKTLAQRAAEIPAAEKIIQNTWMELEEWQCHLANNNYLNKVKNHLISINKSYFNEGDQSRLIRKTISALAVQLKKSKNKGCQCIVALNRFLCSCNESHEMYTGSKAADCAKSVLLSKEKHSPN